MKERPPTSDKPPRGEPERLPPGSDLIVGAYCGNIDQVREALEAGAYVDFFDPATGLTALHIAVGTNDLRLCRYLIEHWHAGIIPDRSGRWPTLIAAQCKAGDELCDYIVEKEAAAPASTSRD